MLLEYKKMKINIINKFKSDSQCNVAYSIVFNKKHNLNKLDVGCLFHDIRLSKRTIYLNK